MTEALRTRRNFFDRGARKSCGEFERNVVAGSLIHPLNIRLRDKLILTKAEHQHLREHLIGERNLRQCREAQSPHWPRCWFHPAYPRAFPQDFPQPRIAT